MTMKELTQKLEERYPLEKAESWDNSVLQVGRKNKAVRKVFLALDATDAVIKEAAESYVADSINDAKEVCETSISVSTLIQDGYLDDEYKKYGYSVKVTCTTKGTNQIYSYEIEK